MQAGQPWKLKPSYFGKCTLLEEPINTKMATWAHIILCDTAPEKLCITGDVPGLTQLATVAYTCYRQR